MIVTTRLGIELTQRCNLDCRHCFKGESTNISITREIIEKVFDEVKFVETLDLSGGEVFLAYNELKMLLDIAKEKNVKILSCSMLTNGTVYDERIYSLLDEYFDDNYQVGVSSDDFHDKSIKRIYNNLKNKSNNPSLAPCNVDEIIENMRKHLLHEKSLGFIGVSNFLIENGRAVTLDVPKKQYEVMGYFYSDFKDKLFVGPAIFIGADGYVTDGNSDISKRKEQSIGNILDSSLEKVIKNGGIKIEISSIEEFYEKMLKREEEFHTLQGDHLTFENNKIIYMDYQTDLYFEKEFEKIDKIIKDLVSLQLDNKPIGEYLNSLDFSNYPYDLSQIEHEKVYKL